MEIKQKIQKQVSAGFTTAEIYNSLSGEGYSKEDIEAELNEYATNVKKANQTNWKAIILGILMLIVVMFRIARYSHNSGTAATFGFISIFTGITLAIYYFTKRK